MMEGKPKNKEKGLSMRKAFSYFLKGNMLFAINGMVLTAIDSVVNIFPPFFQQVYTDNIITRKNPEWFTPLLTLYILLFVVELLIWLSFSVLRRNSMVRLNITQSANYLWSVFRLPMTRLTQFSPGELVARYTSIAKTTRMMDYTLPVLSVVILPTLSCYFVMLFNWKLGLLEIVSVVLLVIVMRTTTNMQKKIAMKQEVTNARLQNVTMTGIGILETIKSLGSEQHFYAQWERTFAQSLNARIHTVKPLYILVPCRPCCYNSPTEPSSVSAYGSSCRAN